jgi:hypothetical protein
VTQVVAVKAFHLYWRGNVPSNSSDILKISRTNIRLDLNLIFYFNLVYLMNCLYRAVQFVSMYHIDLYWPSAVLL